MNEFFGWLVGLLALVLPGFGTNAPPSYNGYVEADYLYVAPPSAGQIATIAVGEGQPVRRGDPLFTLASTQQQALLQGADARLAAAEANLLNLTTGSRADEIEVIRAGLQKAEADLSLARETATRSAKLAAEGLTPQSKLDQDQASLASAEAAVKQLQAQLKVAELPARDAQQIQAEASVTAARADLEKARADLADRQITAPADGRIDKLFFAAGEFAGAGTPVLSLLPEAALKVKFYLPEAARTAFALGTSLAVSCDGCPAGLTADISYFAAEPQFTPPVIYSRDERQRLTFLTEATLAPQSGLHAGQPVSLTRLQ